MSDPYARSRVHPADRAGPLRGRLHAELGEQRLPRHPGPRLRPPVRARVPPRPRRGEAGRHLPPQARRRRLQGRDRCLHARHPGREERQAHRADRRRPRLAHRGARPAAARLHVRAVREGPQGRRADAHQHPLLPPARDGARRGDRPHRAHGHRDPLRPRDQEPRCAAEGRLRRRLHRHRRAQGQRPRHPRPQGSQGQHPYRHRLADLRRLRARAHRRQARGGDRRRQHGDGLLPHRPQARRHGREGHRALAAPRDEGVALGDRGRRARGHPDLRQSRAQGVPARQGSVWPASASRR